MKRSRIVLLSILGIIVVAVVVGVLVLDSVLTSKAHEEADKLSQQLGRKVEIGSVATKIVTGLGVRVSDVSVGPGPGEDLPLVQVPRIEVKAALVQALRTRGKEVTIRSAEIEGLKLNVIRFKDGTTNLERLQKAMAEKEPKKPEEPKDEKPSDLSWLRVDHAALKDARIALVDKTGAAARELAIQNLDVIVNDLPAVKGDSSKGDVQIDKLKLDLGPTGITGQGKATGLASNSPRIEGLEIRSHDLDPEKLAAYYPPLRKSLKGQISGPIGLLVHASGTQASAALELSVDLTPVKLAVPDTLSKAAGAPMMLLAHARGAGGGKLAFDTKLDLAGVDLRPGESLNKAPGQRLELTVQGTRSVSGSSDNPDQRIDLASLVVRVLGDELSAKGFLETKGAGAKKATNFDLTAQSAHLDLDQLLYPNPSKKEKPPPDPKTFAGINGHAKVNIESVRVKKQDLSKIVADVEMHDDPVVVMTAQVGAFAVQF